MEKDKSTIAESETENAETKTPKDFILMELGKSGNWEISTDLDRKRVALVLLGVARSIVSQEMEDAE